MPIDEMPIVKWPIYSRKVARNVLYSTIVVIVSIISSSRTQQLSMLCRPARVILHSKVTVYVLTKKRVSVFSLYSSTHFLST